MLARGDRGYWMNAQHEPGKVVDLSQRQAVHAGGPDRLGELLKSCRGLLQKHLATQISQLFDGVDDALFDMAEKAENNTLQTKIFDGMREVRKRRALMERKFQEQLGRHFAEFNQPNRASKTQERPSEAPSGGLSLSLVEEHVLEEQLAIDSMVGKADTRYNRYLHALNQRFSVLCGGGKIESADNPMGPRAICSAFQLTLPELDAPIEVKLLILKLFDKQVMSNLDALYEDANQILIDAGVLPQLKVQVAPVNRPRNPAAPVPGVVPAGASEEVPVGASYPDSAAYAAAEANVQAEIYNTIRGLLSARHGGYGPVSGSAALPPSGYAAGTPALPSGPVFNSSELLSALSVLQAQLLAVQSQGLFGPPPAPAQVSQQFKEELVQQAQKLSGSEDAKVHAADEDTIDLVGMLFEFILQDRNLPAAVQALLARLQIPFLKAALLDKELFAKKEHPARRLLDELAHAGMSWSEESDRDRRIAEKIRSVVETLLRDFDDDLGLFDRVLKDFTEFMAGQRKRAELAEQRTTEAVRGREKLMDARKRAAKEILTRIEGKNIPEVIRQVLTRPWANVLVLTLLRQGEDSAQWRTALRVADELTWSGLPKETEAERARLRALQPELEKALRQGLQLVGYVEGDIPVLLGQLQDCYQSLLNPTARVVPAAAAPVPSAPTAPRGDLEGKIEAKAPTPAAAEPTAKPVVTPGRQEEPSFVEELARAPQVDESEAPPADAPDDEYARVARNLKVGTWVEFRLDNGQIERAKLSWVSPISSKFLFVNRKGLKVADKTAWGLASDLREQRAVVLEDVPLFDRALDAIVERLKSSSESAAGAPAEGNPADGSDTRAATTPTA